MNRFWFFSFLILLVVGILTGILLTRIQVFSAPEQPIAYSHKTHIEAGIQCLYCHSSPLRSDLAGIPSVKKCMGCHNVIANDKPEVQELAGYWEREEPIPWVRVSSQPEFIYFSHLPHLGTGLSCETCHGDIGQMTVTRPVVKMDMGWCLDCHLKEPQPKATRLADCLACHK
ncbi:MAG: cytochrome c3 family protein [Anaerolineales bacterium]|nr:MAG: cytochrome c3 family protein [Anaerolineales bacterium]